MPIEVLWAGDGQSVVVCLVCGALTLCLSVCLCSLTPGCIPEFVQVGQRTHDHHTTLIIMVIITIIPRDAAL